MEFVSKGGDIFGITIDVFNADQVIVLFSYTVVANMILQSLIVKKVIFQLIVISEFL